jgi:hypothetical protein
MTRAHGPLGLPPARGTDMRVPVVSDRGQGGRRPASSGELKLVGGELARETKCTHAFPVTRCFDSCKQEGLNWSGRGSSPRAAAGEGRVAVCRRR